VYYLTVPCVPIRRQIEEAPVIDLLNKLLNCVDPC